MSYQFETPHAQTLPERLPPDPRMLDHAHYDPAEAERRGVELYSQRLEGGHQLTLNPDPLNPQYAPMLDDHGLLAIVRAGKQPDSLVKVYALHDGTIFRQDAVLVTSNDFQENPAYHRDSNEAVVGIPARIITNQDTQPVIFGRHRRGQPRKLGLEAEDVSHVHFGVFYQPDRGFMVADLGSANGTKVIAGKAFHDTETVAGMPAFLPNTGAYSQPVR